MATAPAELDLTIYQGQDWVAAFELYTDTAQTIPFDATDYEVDMHIREGVADSEASLLAAASTRDTGDGAGRIQWLSRQSSGEVDTDGGEFPADGAFKVTLSAAVTAAMVASKRPRKGDFEIAEWLYDVELTSSSGTVIRVMQGVVNFHYEVTRRS